MRSPDFGVSEQRVSESPKSEHLSQISGFVTTKSGHDPDLVSLGHTLLNGHHLCFASRVFDTKCDTQWTIESTSHLTEPCYIDVTVVCVGVLFVTT